MCSHRKFCFCCSLSTGVLVIGVINLLLSFFPYLNNDISPLARETYIVSLTRYGYSTLELSNFYNIVTILVSISAISSVLSSNRWLLLPLQIWDWFRLIIVLEVAISLFSRSESHSNAWIVCAIILMYCIAVELGYRRELREGSRPPILFMSPTAAATTVTVHAATAPGASTLGADHRQFMAASVAVPVMPDEYCIQSPYARPFVDQPAIPYPVSPAAVAAAMYPSAPPHPGALVPPSSTLPHHLQSMPSHQLPFPHDAPPPYPVVEKPPPYAP